MKLSTNSSPAPKHSITLDYRTPLSAANIVSVCPASKQFNVAMKKPKKGIASSGFPQHTDTILPPNCSLLFKGDSDEMKRVNNARIEKIWPIPSDNEFYRYACNCDWIKKELDSGYYVSEQERQFPLAFALNVYQSPYQIFRFLKVIYRPHNLYCIHYDKKSSEPFKKLMVTIADCLPNVIVPNKIEDVIWGWHTIVDAQMNCIEDLYKMRHTFPWKYTITLCGKEVPLRTNREMVHTLSKLNGTSAIKLFSTKNDQLRWTYKHKLNGKRVKQLSSKLGPIPFNLTIAKSTAYHGLSESFVNYLLHDKEAVKFRRFMEDTKIPDEHFVATLFNRTGIILGKANSHPHTNIAHNNNMHKIRFYYNYIYKNDNIIIVSYFLY